jgi:hypothetical protein
MKKSTSLIVGYLAGTIIMIVLSCNPQKKLNKAIGRVMENEVAVDSIGRHWERSHPCANDTITTTKTDTTTELVFVDADCPTDSTKKDSTGAIVKTKVKVPVNRTIVHTQTENTVVDHRREQLLQADLNKCTIDNINKDAQIAGLKAANKDLTNQIIDMAKKQNWLIWKNRLIVGLPLLLALLGFVFRRKIPFFT